MSDKNDTAPAAKTPDTLATPEVAPGPPEVTPGPPEVTGGSVEAVEKTDLVETDEAPKAVSQERIFGMVAAMAKAAAMEAIQEEIELYRGLVADTEDTDARLKIIRELSDLKLRSVGIVLAGMRQRGAVRFPGEPGAVPPKGKSRG